MFILAFWVLTLDLQLTSLVLLRS